MADRVRTHLHIEHGRATVTLDSPHNRNALSTELLAGLEDSLGKCESSTAVRVVVLTGAGPTFCSGADLKSAGKAQTDGFTRVLERIMRSPKPVVCGLNGPARAGGLGLMAACDIVIAPSSVTFALTEVRLGVVPAIIEMPLARRVNRMWLLEKALTGEAFGAPEALAAGLVNRVVDDAAPGAVEAEVDRFVDLLVRGGPEALAVTKRLIRDLDREAPGAHDRLAHLRWVSEERFASAEAQEGLAAWLEKRDPSWSARRAGGGAVTAS